MRMNRMGLKTDLAEGIVLVIKEVIFPSKFVIFWKLEVGAGGI